MQQIFAFDYGQVFPENGWKVYDAVSEYKRQVCQRDVTGWHSDGFSFFKCSPFLCFKGYTQWKLEDNEGKRPLRSLWHLPVNFSGTCQHTRRRTEEGGCLPCQRKDTRESVAQIQYPPVMEHRCWNWAALYITGAVVDPPREPGDGDALQSAHGWGQWETEQRGWEVPPGNHGC